jgi:DNA ligase 1
MKAFAELFQRLDGTTRLLEKTDALVEYFKVAHEKDALWCIALLTDKRPRRPVNTSLMRTWAADLAGIPHWLCEESYHVVGDLGETLALLTTSAHSRQSTKPLHGWMEELEALRACTDEEKKEYVLKAWEELDETERFIFNKLIGGSFRMGVSRQTLTKALACWSGKEESAVALALMGNWHPANTPLTALINPTREDRSKPYPFYLAHAVESEIRQLGHPSEWLVEYKWDGIRGQLVMRAGETFVWSRGEELVTDKFPELSAMRPLQDAVLDGEIMVHDGEKPLPFALLQTRIGRKNVSRATMQHAPVRFVAYDIMEYRGEDIRHWPLKRRRVLLEEWVRENSHDRILLSPAFSLATWEEGAQMRENARERHSEGLMIKWINGAYLMGRKKGEWWKWKVDPLTVDAVMIYAMQGSGRRANLFTDYTFAVWDNERLVPFAKAYSGLTDEEIKEVDAWIRKNTTEKFGPVRSVVPSLVFELGFEGIQASSRHKSGLAVRFPRIVRWRKDKPTSEANSLDDLRRLMT